MLAGRVAGYIRPVARAAGGLRDTRYLGPGAAVISRGDDVARGLGHIHVRSICKRGTQHMKTEKVLDGNEDACDMEW